MAAFLPFALLWLPPAHWRAGPLIGAGVLTVGIVAVALRRSWDQGPSWGPSGLAYGYLLVVVLLRAAGGASGVSAMVLLPVFWMGLYGTRRQLWTLLIGTALIFVIPLIVVGGRDYPSSAWRAEILFVTLSGIVGFTLQVLMGHVRAHADERDRLLARLDELAHTDELTGLPNRRAWSAELDRGLARAQRTREPMTVAVIDIDRFKAVNDVYGHPAGDALLMNVAHQWGEVLRPDDMLARVGGDEFALLMPACAHAEAEAVIGRLRTGMPDPHSCSVGLATWDGSEAAESLMSRSDSALYEAKRSGSQPFSALSGGRAAAAARARADTAAPAG